MLKQVVKAVDVKAVEQPPSGGCVLKHPLNRNADTTDNQPPSGGCVLKQATAQIPAPYFEQPPSGGCVLKQQRLRIVVRFTCSRLRAAVC